MKNNGYVLIHRKIQDSILWEDPEPFCHRAAWIDLIMRANYQDNQMRDKYGQIRTIHRGQCVVSIRHLANDWGWSICKVQSFLKSLKELGQIYAWGYKFGTLVTIVNYDKYQNGTAQDNTQSNTPKRRKSGKCNTPETAGSNTQKTTGNATGARSARNRMAGSNTPTEQGENTQTDTRANTQTDTKQIILKNGFKEEERKTAAAGDFSFSAAEPMKPKEVAEWEMISGCKVSWNNGQWEAPGNIVWLGNRWADNEFYSEVVYKDGRWESKATGGIWNGEDEYNDEPPEDQTPQKPEVLKTLEQQAGVTAYWNRKRWEAHRRVMFYIDHWEAIGTGETVFRDGTCWVNNDGATWDGYNWI